MAICKVSYVVRGSEHPGGIVNLTTIPIIGERIQVGDLTLVIQEVVELMPPRGEFHYFHVTCFIQSSSSTKQASEK